MRSAAFWLAVGLAGVVTDRLLKILAGRFRLPEGFEAVIGS